MVPWFLKIRHACLSRCHSTEQRFSYSGSARDALSFGPVPHLNSHAPSSTPPRNLKEAFSPLSNWALRSASVETRLCCARYTRKGPQKRSPLLTAVNCCLGKNCVSSRRRPRVLRHSCVSFSAPKVSALDDAACASFCRPLKSTAYPKRKSLSSALLPMKGLCPRGNSSTSKRKSLAKGRFLRRFIFLPEKTPPVSQKWKPRAPASSKSP